jgi:hypothetical protein
VPLRDGDHAPLRIVDHVCAVFVGVRVCWWDGYGLGPGGTDSEKASFCFQSVVSTFMRVISKLGV